MKFTQAARPPDSKPAQDPQMVQSDLPISVLFNDQAKSIFFSIVIVAPRLLAHTLAIDGHPAMTEQEKLLRGISTLKALIQLDLDNLHGKTLPAEQRQVIKNHLDGLISDMQTLLQRLEPSPSSAGIPSPKCNPNDLAPKPPPNDTLKIVVHGADKEDRSAA